MDWFLYDRDFRPEVNCYLVSQACKFIFANYILIIACYLFGNNILLSRSCNHSLDLSDSEIYSVSSLSVDITFNLNLHCFLFQIISQVSCTKVPNAAYVMY